MKEYGPMKKSKARFSLIIIGPSIIAVLTWFGPGDLVETTISGGNYGYSLIWTVPLAVTIRLFFVSMIAKYEISNQHNEGILNGVKRVHNSLPKIIAITALIMGHAYCSYMTLGVGEVVFHFLKTGEVWIWSVLMNILVTVFLFIYQYKALELLFKAVASILLLTILGTAIYIGPNLSEIISSIMTLKIPDNQGRFDAALVMVSTLGTIGGSIMNFVYPYYIRERGWKGKQFRKLQNRDLFAGALVFVLLNMAVWTLGAELLHNNDLMVSSLTDLPQILILTIGKAGEVIFFIGIFFAILSSLIGFATGLSRVFADGMLVGGEEVLNITKTRQYRASILFCLVTSLIWTIPGITDFLTLTLLVNSLQIVLLPGLCLLVWLITSKSRFIGKSHANNFWENLAMGLVFILSVWGSYKSVETIFF